MPIDVACDVAPGSSNDPCRQASQDRQGAQLVLSPPWTGAGKAVHRGARAGYAICIRAKAFQDSIGTTIADSIFCFSEHGAIECSRDIPPEFIEGVYYCAPGDTPVCVWHFTWPALMAECVGFKPEDASNAALYKASRNAYRDGYDMIMENTRKMPVVP